MDQEYQKFLSDLLEGNLDENYLPDIPEDKQYENYLNELLEGKMDETKFEDQIMNQDFEDKVVYEDEFDYFANIRHHISQIRQMISDPYGKLYSITQIKNRSGKYTEFGQTLRNQVFSYLSSLSKKDLETIFLRMYFPEVRLIGRMFDIRALIENRTEYISLIIQYLSNPSIQQNKKRKVIS